MIKLVKRRSLLVLLLSLLVLLTSSLSCYAAENAEGYSIYCDGNAINPFWHAGLVTNQTVSPIVHINSPLGPVVPAEYSDFVGNSDFMGIKKPKGSYSNYQRNRVIETGNELKSEQITYTVIGQVDPNLYAIGDLIEKSDIIGIRCDGVVEYSFEYNGIPICGDSTSSTWNVAKNDIYSTFYHAGTNVTPKKQAEDWMDPVATWMKFGNSVSKYTDGYDWYTGLEEIDGDWYYFDPDTNAMHTGLLEYDDKFYYFDGGGRRHSGFLQMNSDTFYFDPDTGFLCKGLLEISGKFYYFNNSGVMQKGYVKVNGIWYLFDIVTGVRQPGDYGSGTNPVGKEYITGAATRDAQPMLEILGISSVEESGQFVDLQNPLNWALPKYYIMGTDINVNPNPYFYNYIIQQSN